MSCHYCNPDNMTASCSFCSSRLADYIRCGHTDGGYACQSCQYEAMRNYYNGRCNGDVSNTEEPCKAENKKSLWQRIKGVVLR